MSKLSAAVCAAGVAALLLSLPATAAAPATGAFVASKVQRGYKLSFQVAGGKVTKLRAVVLEQCAGDSTSRTATLASDASWTVAAGRFSKRIKERFGEVTAYTTFEDRFTSPTTAAGTVRQETVVAGAVCDTYELRWTAKRS